MWVVFLIKIVILNFFQTRLSNKHWNKAKFYLSKHDFIQWVLLKEVFMFYKLWKDKFLKFPSLKNFHSLRKVFETMFWSTNELWKLDWKFFKIWLILISGQTILIFAKFLELFKFKKQQDTTKTMNGFIWWKKWPPSIRFTINWWSFWYSFFSKRIDWYIYI